MREGYAVNARFVTQPLTGVQRYCYEVSRLLRGATFFSPAPPLPCYGSLDARVHVTGGYLGGHAWEQITLPRSVPSGAALLSPAGCGPISHSNHVVVVHDVTVLENPEWYGRAYGLWHTRLLPVLARNARLIVTVSQFCKERIGRFLGVPERKVVVASEAAGSRFFSRSSAEISSAVERLGIHGPYFLAIGAVSPRKNFSRLMAAWERVRSDVGGASLVLVGLEGLRFSRRSSLGSLPLGVFRVGAVYDEDLACLYSGARALLYPSLYEGFGLPIVEAMACGCPVLASNVSAIPEVAGDAALLVDPLSETSIADGIRSIARERLRVELVGRGLARCTRFSWERTASITEVALLN